MPASLSLLPTPAAMLPLVAVIPPQAGQGSPRMSEADADLELVRRVQAGQKNAFEDRKSVV